MIGNSAEKPVRVATRLTRNSRSRAREGIRRGPRRPPRTERPALPNGCRSCGLKLDDPARAYCDECLIDFRAEHTGKLAMAGPAALAEMRADGRDPTQTPEARAKLSESMSRRGLDVSAWDREPERPDPEVFRRDILPGLERVPLARIVVRTGLSLRYASLIRRGLRVPHPMHWVALNELRAWIDHPTMNR